MRERSIETYFVNLCCQQGWMCEKFTSPGKRGVPDRIITVGPKGFICFAEIKAPGEHPTRLQHEDHKQRERKGVKVFIVDSKYKAREVVAKIRRLANGEQ